MKLSFDGHHRYDTDRSSAFIRHDLTVPSRCEFDGGQTISLDIDMSSITDLYAWQLDVGFNPSVLSAVSITEGAFLASGGTTVFLPGTIDNVSGTVVFTANTLLGAITGVTGNGTLATILFSTLSPGSSTINLSNVILLDSNLNTLDATEFGSTVTVTGTSVIPEPSSSLLVVLGAVFLAMHRRRAHAVFNLQKTPLLVFAVLFCSHSLLVPAHAQKAY